MPTTYTITKTVQIPDFPGYVLNPEPTTGVIPVGTYYFEIRKSDGHTWYAKPVCRTIDIHIDEFPERVFFTYTKPKQIIFTELMENGKPIVRMVDKGEYYRGFDNHIHQAVHSDSFQRYPIYTREDR